MLRSAIAALAGLSLCLAGCDLTDGPIPSSFAVVEPGPTTLQVADTTAASVRIADEEGRGIPGMQVTWAVLAGGGTLAEAEGLTDEDGKATALWVLGTTAGAQTLQAESEGFEPLLIEIHAVPRDPVSISLGSDTVRFDALGESRPVGVELADSYGNVVSGADVTWSALDTTVAVATDVGAIEPRGNGHTEVIAASGPLADTVHVQVQQRLKTIAFAPADSLARGDTVMLTAKGVDANGFEVPGVALSWTAADTSVVRIQDSGSAWAVSVGDTEKIITAGSADTVIVDTGRVHVYAEILFEDVILGVQGLYRTSPYQSDPALVVRGKYLNASWMPGGERVLIHVQEDTALYTVPRVGGERTLVAKLPNFGGCIQPSPSGSEVASHGYRDRHYVAIADLDGSNLYQVTPDSLNAACPDWSPDGQKLVYQEWDAAGQTDLYIINRDGTGRTALTTDSSTFDYQPKWSPDGSQIVFYRVTPHDAGNYTTDIFRISVDGANEEQLTHWHGYDSHSADWSPTGEQIVFFRSEGLWVMDADGSDSRWLRSGTSPSWTP